MSTGPDAIPVRFGTTSARVLNSTTTLIHWPDPKTTKCFSEAPNMFNPGIPGNQDLQAKLVAQSSPL